jgi:CheY-like chemotaxis protein/DNA-binding transcriptional ArsR family regulator
MKILLVDDDVELLDQMSKFLEKREYSVETASSGAKALEKLKDGAYDIVITDLKMPKVTGMDVLREAKRVSPSSFVIILTGYGTIENAVEAMKVGAYEYLTKPFKTQDLLEKIELVSKEMKLDKDMKTIKLIEEFKGIDYLDFLKEYNIDRPLLLITTKDPDKILERFEVEKPEVVWLSDKESPIAIPPRKLVLLKDKIKLFSGNHEKGIVFVQGLEQLIDVHGWNNVKRFLYFISNEVMKDGFQLILTVRPETIDNEAIREVAGLMAKDFVKAVGDSLSNRARVGIISLLAHEKELSFTNIKSDLKVVNSSALAFHLKKLLKEDFIYLTSEKKYMLTDKGVKFYELIRSIEDVSITDIGSKFFVLLDEGS